MKKLTLIASGFMIMSLLASCGEEKHEHSFVKVDGVAATCTESGVAEHYTCSSCKKLFDSNKSEITDDKLVITALGHDLSAEWASDKTNHYHICKREGCDYKGDIASHTLVEIGVIDPTCTKDGSKTMKCSVCNKEVVETLTKLDHSWDEGKILENPTCENDGSIVYECTRPGCGESKVESIKKLGHNWDFDHPEVISEPDCTHSGENHIHCLNEGCEKYEVETVDPVGHISDGIWHYDDNEHWHLCVREECGEKVDIAKHSSKEEFNMDETHHWHECTSECGAKLDYAEHTVSEWTPVKPASRTEEGEEKGACSGCKREVVRKISRLAPTPAEMISIIDGLDEKGLTIQKFKIDSAKADFDLMSATDKLLVTNAEKLNSLVEKNANNEVLVSPYNANAVVRSYGDKYQSEIVDDPDFGKVFHLFNGTITSYGIFAIDGDDIVADDGIGSLAFFAKGVDSTFLETWVVNDFGEAKTWDLESEPFAKFFAQENDSAAADRAKWVKQWKDTIGNPTGWKMYMINMQIVHDLLDIIRTNGYFSFKVNGNHGSDFYISGLYGVRNVGVYENKIVRKYSNGYPNFSGLKQNNTNKDWATMQSKYNDWGNEFKLYSYYNEGSSEVDGKNGIVLTTAKIVKGETYSSMYFYIYVSLEISINLKVGSDYRGAKTFNAGWNKIEMKSNELTIMNGDSNVNLTLFIDKIPVGFYIATTPFYGAVA